MQSKDLYSRYIRCIHKRITDMDIFDNVVLCRECNKKMEKMNVLKNGFTIRVLECPDCNKKIMHPSDIEEYKKFSLLKNRFFHVKLRMVGNSYAVSIPHEIIGFLKETDEIKKKMDSIVTLAFEEMGKLSLIFNDKENYIKKDSIKRIY